MLALEPHFPQLWTELNYDLPKFFRQKNIVLTEDKAIDNWLVLSMANEILGIGQSRGNRLGV
jgi:hypothetical protein